MLKIWDPTNFRRTLGGLCLILAPILFAVAEITYPASDGNGAAQLDIAARNHDVMLADIYFGIASAILFIPAVYALLHVTRRRGVVLGHIAAILTVAGVCLAHLALGGLQLMLWAMAGDAADSQVMASFIDKTQQNPAGLPLVEGRACLTAHSHAPDFSWQENFQVRGDLVRDSDGWALVPHKLVGGFELPDESMLARYRRNLGKSMRFYRIRKRFLRNR